MLNPQFGSGVLFGIPTAGNLATNPTPLQFGILQEVSLEIKGDLKKLYGMYQSAIATARGKIDVTAKGKLASLDLMLYSQLYFGQPTSVGVMRPAFNEPQAAASSVTPNNAAVGGDAIALTDMGVIIASGGGFTPGLQMTAVPSGTPTTGEYKFVAPTVGSPGTPASYVFAAADVSAGLNVLLSYRWNDATHGTTLHVTNQLMGFAPQIQALLYNDFRGAMFGCLLYNAVLGSISIPTKQEDFWVSDFDLDASCDVSGNLLDIISDQL